MQKAIKGDMTSYFILKDCIEQMEMEDKIQIDFDKQEGYIILTVDEEG